MTRTILIAAAALVATPALASMATFDADADGSVTYEEMVAVLPDASVETFEAADTNVDTVLSEDELTAAMDAGLIALPEG